MCQPPLAHCGLSGSVVVAESSEQAGSRTAGLSVGVNVTVAAHTLLGFCTVTRQCAGHGLHIEATRGQGVTAEVWEPSNCDDSLSATGTWPPIQSQCDSRRLHIVVFLVPLWWRSLGNRPVLVLPGPVWVPMCQPSLAHCGLFGFVTVADPRGTGRSSHCQLQCGCQCASCHSRIALAQRQRCRDGMRFSWQTPKAWSIRGA